MIYYSYDEFKDDIVFLAKEIKKDFNPDAIVGIARGGLTMAHCLSVALDIRSCFSLNSIHYEDTQKLDTIKLFNIPDLSGYDRILLVDDIVDSGETVAAIKENLSAKFERADVRVVTMFYKPKALVLPEYKMHEAKDWVEFFWDIKI